MGVGMPADLYLQEFGSQLWSAFGTIAFHVGSSLESKTGWRDVDIRTILDDGEWSRWGFRDPKRGALQHRDLKWIALCLAFSELGRKMTGLPIDFQLQQMTQANEEFKGRPRSAIGMVPLRLKEPEAQP